MPPDVKRREVEGRLSKEPTDRAWAIAAGLVRTRRAATYEAGDSFICAEGIGVVRYWISADGDRLLRGRRLTDAEELQVGFIDAMARAGAAS